jgi:hypothetical protein
MKLKMLSIALNLTPIEILNIPESDNSIPSIPSPLANKIDFFFSPDISTNLEKTPKKRGRPTKEEYELKHGPKVCKTTNSQSRKLLMDICLEHDINVNSFIIVSIAWNPVKVLIGKNGFKLYNAIDLIEPFVLHRNNASRYANILDDYNRVKLIHSSWVNLEGVKKLIMVSYRKKTRFDKTKLDYLEACKKHFNFLTHLSR